MHRLAVVVEPDGGDLVGEDFRAAEFAADNRVAAHHAFNEVEGLANLQAGWAAHAGPGLADIEQAVVVGAGGDGLPPRSGVAWAHGVLGAEFVDALGCERAEVALHGVASRAAVRAVDEFDALEEEHALLEVFDGVPARLGVERVRERVGEVAIGEPVGELVHIIAEPERGDLGVEFGGEPVDEDMEFHAVGGEADGDFLPDEHMGEAALDEGERAADGVVVGDGDEVHAARDRLHVDLFGFGVALRRVDPGCGVDDGTGGGGRVDMHVHAREPCEVDRFVGDGRGRGAFALGNAGEAACFGRCKVRHGDGSPSRARGWSVGRSAPRAGLC